MTHVEDTKPEPLTAEEEAVWRDQYVSGKGYLFSQRLAATLDAARVERDDLQATFDLCWEADQRAIKAWQEKTGETLTWPDRAKLVEWLLAERDALRAETEVVRRENERLRAALAQSDRPCAYCSLPADEWAKCQQGFPGCDRADDAMGCPELGARLEADALRALAAELVEGLAEMFGEDLGGDMREEWAPTAAYQAWVSWRYRQRMRDLIARARELGIGGEREKSDG